jgi:pimeloyl-ACP methyl ester carboxylesterase
VKTASKAIPYNRGYSVDIKPLPRPSWLSDRVWRFQTSGLEVDGSTVAVTDVGEGPVLLFVHVGTWSFVWCDVMTRLANDYRCVALDAPGTGRSDRLPMSEIGFEGASRAVTAVIEALDLSDLTLVFHDLGGPTAIAGAARTAERVRGLVAINTFAWKPSGAMLRGMLALMGSAAVREFDAHTGLLARISASSFGVGRHLDGESRTAFRAGIGADGLRAFHAYMRDARTSESIYQQAGTALAGPFKRLPLLTIFGERNDPFGFQPRWKRMFPEASQVVVGKGNHFPMCDDPDLVATSISSWHRERVACVLQ